jgi:hypothetical protein
MRNDADVAIKVEWFVSGHDLGSEVSSVIEWVK